MWAKEAMGMNLGILGADYPGYTDPHNVHTQSVPVLPGIFL